MRRLLVVIFGILAATFGIAAPAIGSLAGPSNLEVVRVYAYDWHHHPAVSTSSTTEPGPPDATTSRRTSYDAIDHCSRGASARSGDPATRAIYHYDDLALFVQYTRDSGNDREEPVGSVAVSLDVVEQLSVAANTGKVIAGPNLGVLSVTARAASTSEVRAAEYLAAQGNRVLLRDPVAGAARGSGTRDLLVNGVQWDVYSPVSSNPSAIISAIAKKGSQVPGGGVVVDLSGTSVSAADLGDVAARVAGTGSRVGQVVILP